MAKKSFKNFLLSLCSKHGENWNIGIVKYDNSLIFSSNLPKVTWLKHDIKGWFADPFILSEDEFTYTILVEAMMNDTRKGSIAQLIVNKKDFSLKEMKIILELDTHLSFPAIQYEQNIVKIYPENFQSGCNKIYEYTCSGLVNAKMQCDYPLIDAIIFEYGGEQYMTATLAERASGSQVTILKFNNATQRFVLFQEIQLDDKTARGAGAFFKVDGRLIRPAQNCNSGYGRGLVFQEIKYNGNKFDIIEINRVNPFDKKYKNGLHTFNKFNSIVVLDGYYYLPKIVRFPLRVLNKLLSIFGLSDGLF